MTEVLRQSIALSDRVQAVEPFFVMEIAKEASRLAAEVSSTDRPMIFLNIGEPDFSAPPLVQQAALQTIEAGRTQYTPATGLPQLREAISRWYAERFGIEVDSRRIIVTAGASAALHLACLALLNPGDEILMPDPCYPCNRQFVHAAGGISRLLPTQAEQRFQLTAQQVADDWSPKTRGVMLASPSNPTGTSIAAPELAAICEQVRARNGITIVDEIYLGLSHDDAYGQSALALSDDVISINSFSKYFCMTGWRLGWLVVPPSLVDAIERLTQHLFICPSTVSQYAALACFAPESIAEYERRRQAFKARRDYFIPQLNRLGLPVPVMPDGAFYAYADCTQAAQRLGVSGSWDFAFELMRRAHLVVTPGRDFGHADPQRYVRFSTASSMEHLEQAVARLEELLS